MDLAKIILPASSPWRERIDQAAQMAQQLPSSKDGVAQLMAQQGKRKQDLEAAINSLNSPLIQNLLGRVPGLSGVLQGAANELVNDPNFGGMTNSNANPASQQMATNGNSALSLAERLRRLG